MWTPKRILLLVLGIVIFCASYFGYSRSRLGAIDGLPALPENFRRPMNSQDVTPPPQKGDSRLEEKLKQAHGEACQELSYPIKLELRSKRMVIAAGQAKFDDDGRVSLAPISIAIFGEEKHDGRGVEINTVRGDLAFLTFDRPVHSPQDINGHKIVAAELSGKIVITNNRRTPERTDDLYLYIDKGPLFYDGTKHLIWTEDNIYLRDLQSTPKPIEVRGKGMEVELVSEAPPKPGTPAAARNNKNKTDTITGIRRLTLRSNVEMYLYVDANRSGMPGGTLETRAAGNNGEVVPVPPGAKRPSKAAAEEKALVIVKTPGRFEYVLDKDHDRATFDIPPGKPSEVVTVDRHIPKLKFVDHLICKHLELRLHRKDSATKPDQPNAAPVANRSPDQGIEVEIARATGGSKEVCLASDSEKLEAHGNEFVHDTRKMLTILRGMPEMEADKEGHKIHARELQIQQVPDPSSPPGPDGKPRTMQQVTARGPGVIHMKPKQGPDRANDHASWSDLLTYGRDGRLDLLVLTGSARFWNDVPGDALQGDTLKVWMLPRSPEPDPMARSQPSGLAGTKVERMESAGNVFMRSRELLIHDTSRLVVKFKPLPPGLLPPPSPDQPGTPRLPGASRMAPVHEVAKPVEKPIEAKAPATTAPATPRPTPPPAPAQSLPQVVATLPPTAAPAPRPTPGIPTLGAPTTPAKPDEAPRPIDLSARSIDAVVLRGDKQNQLENLWCEGRVQVRQAGDPKDPNDRGLDIKGSTLKLDWFSEGSVLTVAADDKPNEEDLAQLQMNSLYLIGPVINIDQRENKAWVDGTGAMQIMSGTTLAGAKSDKPIPLTIHWNKSMLFTGKTAMFQGEIQAEHDSAHMACEALTVFFDRVISLKPKKPEERTPEAKDGKEKQAKVDRIVCDRRVTIEEATIEIDPRTGKERQGKYTRVVGTTADVLANEKDDPSEKDTNVMNVSGPGSVKLMQRGGTDIAAPGPGAVKPKPGPKTGDEEQMKITYVEFGKRLQANNKTGKASFWGGVRVLNIPGNDPRVDYNLDLMASGDLPKDAMYLTAERLEVIGQKTPQGKTNQEMTAVGRVTVTANEFWARCDTLHFDESKDQIILRGNENSLATLSRQILKGKAPDVITGKEIIYIRSTGAFKVDGGGSIQGALQGAIQETPRPIPGKPLPK